jgi:hypothetical protein
MVQDDTIATQLRSTAMMVETNFGTSSGLGHHSPDRTPAEMADPEVIRIALIDSIQS